MSTSDSAREPSMEDILASIRKIIAEDPAPAAAADASDPETSQASAPAAAPSTPTQTEAAASASSGAASPSIPMSGRLADALGGLKSAASGKDTPHATDTPKPRPSSFGVLDDDLADLLDDAPAEPKPASQPSPNSAAPKTQPTSSPFGSSFNPPAGLRAGRSVDPAGPARDEKPSTSPSPDHGADDKALPFGVKSDREPVFSSERLLKASSSLLGKSPDYAAKNAGDGDAGDANTAGNTKSHAEPSDIETAADDVPEAPQGKSADTKTTSESSGPVVIAAMPPSAKLGNNTLETAKTGAAAENELAQGSVQRASTPRPIGFALGAGMPSSGQSAPDKTPGSTHETPSQTAQKSSGQGFAPSSSGGDAIPGAPVSNADNEVTEPILMPTTRDAASTSEALASTSALDELAAGLAASVGSVAGGAAPGIRASASGTADTPSPASEVSQSPSSSAPASASAPEFGTSGRTLEETVGELLRPMLREWLDANMPRIVENALRAEMSEGVSKSLSSGPAVPTAPNIASGFGAKKPN